MGLLAYDLRRLEALRVALGAALDDLHAIRCDDAAAEPAMTVIRTATRTLNEFCIPRVHDILASDSMTSYHAADVDGNAIHNSLVYTMATSYRWKVSTDPFEDDAQIVTVEEARALGFRLQHGDLDKLTSTAAERAFIVQQLAVITADPRLQAEFLANLTDLERLAEHYALKRLELIDSMTRRGAPENALVDLQRIDDTFASLTRLYVSPRSSTYPGWVADVEPITAALLLRYAGLDPTTLGHVSNDLVVRWRMADPYEDEGRELPWWSDYDYAGPNTADIVFELLLATPGASTVYVIDAAELPESMWFSADDPLLAQRVALQGTDPRNIGPAAAGTVLRSFIEFSLSDRYRYSNDLAVAHPTGYTTFLGTLVAPWMLQFASKNTDWDCVIDSGDRTELLRTVLEDDGALAALTAANNVAVSALAGAVSAGGSKTLKEHGELISMLGELIIDQRVTNEEERRALWEMWIQVAALVPSLIPGVNLAAGVAIDIAVAVASDVTGDHLLPDPDDVEDRAEYELEWMTTIAGYSVVVAACRQLGIDSDDVPEPDPEVTDPRRAFDDALDDWARRQPGPHGRQVIQYKDELFSAMFVGQSGT